MFRCVVSAICGNFRFGKEAEEEAATIAWNDCQPFIPPITGGYVIKVYDGDTITIAGRLPYPESPLYRFSVRLLGIDSPEIKGKTEKEKEAAHKSQHALESLILHRRVALKEISTEKYGRILANVYIVTDTGEILVNKWMLANGHAVPYDGKTKQQFDPDSSI